MGGKRKQRTKVRNSNILTKPRNGNNFYSDDFNATHGRNGGNTTRTPAKAAATSQPKQMREKKAATITSPRSSTSVKNGATKPRTCNN